MYEFTMRQKNIIKILQGSSESINGKVIADTLNVSLRTVQNEMNELKKIGMVSSDKTGYTLIENNTNLTRIDNNDRKSTILQYLLSSNKPLDTFDLADKLYISESSLQLEFSRIKQDFNDKHLSLVIKNNTVTIDGTEFNKRQLLK